MNYYTIVGKAKRIRTSFKKYIVEDEQTSQDFGKRKTEDLYLYLIDVRVWVSALDSRISTYSRAGATGIQSLSVVSRQSSPRYVIWISY